MVTLFRKPVLTRRRIWLAFAIAVAVDATQMILGPFGWLLVDQMLDVIGMVLLSFTIGFHPLFLPTFIAEFIPVVDFLPTWIGCVAVVVVRRWKQQQEQANVPPRIPPQSDVIDV